MIANVHATLTVVVIAVAVAVAIMIVIMIVIAARVITHAVVTIPALAASAVATLVFDHASRHQAQRCTGY